MGTIGKLLIMLTLAAGAKAGMLIAPETAMKLAFGAEASVTKKSRMLNDAQIKEVAAIAKEKPGDKIYRVYLAEAAGKTLGTGILLSRKVRTKNAAVLYMIAPGGTVKRIEIVAFSEPPEYLPRPEYLAHFEGKRADDRLQVGDTVPMLSGATLSARTVTDGARLALALYEVLYGERK